MSVNQSEQNRRYSQHAEDQLSAPLRALGADAGEDLRVGGEQILDKALQTLRQSRELLARADKVLLRR